MKLPEVPPWVQTPPLAGSHLVSTAVTPPAQVDPPAAPKRRTRRSSIEKIVKADLARIPHLDVGTRPTLVAMSLNLARIIDSWGDQETYSAAQLSALVKAHQSLAAMMAKLSEVPSEQDDFDERMGRPVGPSVPAPARHPKVVGPGDVGSPDSGDRRAAG